ADQKTGRLQSLGDGIYRKGAKYPMPEGGLYATAQDMAAFYQMMLNNGSYQGKRVLSKASVDVMTMVHTGATAVNWGLGWGVSNGVRGAWSLTDGAYGHLGAFGTFGWVDPKKNMTGVFMVQRFGEGAETARSAFISMANAAVVD